MDLSDVAHKVATITGDTSIGRPTPTIRPNGASSVTFQGSKGWYDVVDLASEGMFILFLEGQAKPTGKIIGTYYTHAKSADLTAAKLILHIFTNLEPLVFQVGYMSSDKSGVNWKLFRAPKGVEVLLKSRREAANTDCEIIVGSLVVGMKITASGRVKDIREMISSRL